MSGSPRSDRGGAGPSQSRSAAFLHPGLALGCKARVTGGWKAFDVSTGFRLPDNSVLSPDASLATRRAHRVSTTAAQKPDGFGRLQSEQALLHARAITEWIRAALASRR